MSRAGAFKKLIVTGEKAEQLVLEQLDRYGFVVRRNGWGSMPEWLQDQYRHLLDLTEDCTQFMESLKEEWPTVYAAPRAYQEQVTWQFRLLALRRKHSEDLLCKPRCQPCDAENGCVENVYDLTCKHTDSQRFLVQVKTRLPGRKNFSADALAWYVYRYVIARYMSVMALPFFENADVVERLALALVDKSKDGPPWIRYCWIQEIAQPHTIWVPETRDGEMDESMLLAKETQALLEDEGVRMAVEPKTTSDGSGNPFVLVPPDEKQLLPIQRFMIRNLGLSSVRTRAGTWYAMPTRYIRAG
jgi:hypothetical protein